MFDIELSEKDIIETEGTSEGTQVKYFKDGYWYKKNNLGEEGLAEYLVSLVLSYSTLSPAEYVIYEQGLINGSRGCRSKSFLSEDEELITIYRLYQNAYFQNISAVQIPKSMEERIEHVLDFIRERCQVDFFPALQKIITIDTLVLNEDRHFNNIALLYSQDVFRPAPLFDHGMSLLTANRSVNWRAPISENVKKTIARPFSGSFTSMFEYFGVGFQIDYEGLYKRLSEEPDSEELMVLKYQLERYRDKLAL